MTIEQRREEILKAHGLDFKIIKTPLVANYNGSVIESDYFGLINSKSGNVINSVKGSYYVSQNDEIVDLVLHGISKFGSQLQVTKAGSINDGRKVFLQLKIEGVGKVNEDVIEKYITIIDSNDGSTSLSVGIGDLTMSCQNQFYKFYKAGESKFRHSESMQKRISEIPMLVELALNQSMEQIEFYNRLSKVSVTKRLVHEAVKNLLGYDKVITSPEKFAELTTKSINHMEKLYSHIEKETQQKGVNLFGLHSGVTSWTTHELKKPTRDNGEIESILVGNAYKHNIKSLEFVGSLI